MHFSAVLYFFSLVVNMDLGFIQLVQVVVLVSHDKVKNKQKINVHVWRVGGEAGWMRHTVRRREGRVTTVRRRRKPTALFTDSFKPKY